MSGHRGGIGAVTASSYRADWEFWGITAMHLLRLPISALCLSLAMAGGGWAMDAGLAPFLPSKKPASAPEGATNLCQNHPWACAAGTSDAPLTPETLADVVKVNRSANRAIQSITDLDQYDVAEHWAMPGPEGGDCEDFALFKKQALIEAGVSPDRLLIAVVLDRRDNPHAVLVLRTDRGDYVLDNVTNRIVTWDRTGYTFISMQNPEDPSGWVTVFEQAQRPKISLKGALAGLFGKRDRLVEEMDSLQVETGTF